MITIPKRQFDVLKVFYEFEQADRYLPTMVEIGVVLGISKRTVLRHIQLLVELGYLKKLRKGCKTRNYRLTETGTQMVEDNKETE